MQNSQTVAIATTKAWLDVNHASNCRHSMTKDQAIALIGAAVDYSRQPLSTDPEERATVGESLGRVGALLESALGEPQDVEGGIVDGEVYVVQSRPQE